MSLDSRTIEPLPASIDLSAKFQHWVRSTRSFCIWQGLWESRRRQAWIFEGMTVTDWRNLAGCLADFLTARRVVRGWPLVIKIDTTPLCNLHCSVCIHAKPDGNPILARQCFHASQRMSVPQFQHIVDEIRGRVRALTLHFLGDPLMHPELDTLCRIATCAGINTHISTNFSFHIEYRHIKDLLTSGLTHLSVCIDGLTQSVYDRTRSGGKIDRVLDNLRTACRVRRELHLRHPHIEVQYLLFNHNSHELPRARRLCHTLGVDQFTVLPGNPCNYSDAEPENFEVLNARRPGRLPMCFWPFFTMLIKYNGDVIPCCEHRSASQYTTNHDACRVLGNVFDSSVWAVWNSPAYQQVRSTVSNPLAASAQPGHHTNFCSACQRLFDLRRLRWAGTYTNSMPPPSAKSSTARADHPPAPCPPLAEHATPSACCETPHHSLARGVIP